MTQLPEAEWYELRDSSKFRESVEHVLHSSVWQLPDVNKDVSTDGRSRCDWSRSSVEQLPEAKMRESAPRVELERSVWQLPEVYMYIGVPTGLEPATTCVLTWLCDCPLEVCNGTSAGPEAA